MAEQLKLVAVGGLGLMLSPAAKHLTGDDSPARFVRVHDRGTRDERRDRAREAWRQHGAERVSTFGDLVGDGRIDGAVICAGKNGDDLQILRELVPLMHERGVRNGFILHLSTVSTNFAEAAEAFCRDHGLDYGNYPLTGGPAGAEAATMLILASGDRDLYGRLEPMLQKLGKPRYFGERVTAGAEVKLIGHYMVFNGLMGIASGAALHAACFGHELGDPAQVDFFEFLNAGAGGTRQWEVALSKGIRDHVWDQGFMLQHAVVDAIYAAKLGMDRGLAGYALLSMLMTALGFAFLLNTYPGQPLATHAIVREMIGANRQALDDFVYSRLNPADVAGTLRQCVEALPEAIRRTVLLDIQRSDFG